MIARGAPLGGPAPATGVALVLLAAVLWSTSGLFIKLLALDAFAFTGLRAALAAAALAPFVRWRAVRLDGRLALLVAAFGATALAFVPSTLWTTAANAIALQSTAPAWVFALGWLATRRAPLALLAPLGLIGAGIAIMLAEPAHGTSLRGNLLGLAGGFCFGVTQIAAKRVNQPAVGAVALANLGTALGCLALAPGAFALGAVTPWEWVALVYLGAVQIALGFLCFILGVQRISVGQASVLSLLEPLLNPVWVFLVIGEAPSAYGFAGYALILAGIVVDLWLRMWLPSRQPVGPAARAAP